MYIASCHRCQMIKQGKSKQRYREGRIFLNYRPMSKVSMDIKYMPKAGNGMKFILVIIDDNLNIHGNCTLTTDKDRTNM